MQTQNATEMDRAIECVYSLRADDASKVLKGIKAIILNNLARSKEFLVFSEQSAGEVFSSASVSERGKSCVAE